MSLYPGILCAIVGFLTCWALVPIIQRQALWRKVSRGGEFHHTHKGAIPRCGGLALVCAFVASAVPAALLLPPTVTSVRSRLLIVVGAVAMFGLGFWDDVKGVGAKKKLLAQVVIAICMYFGGIQIEVFNNPFTRGDLPLGMFSMGATVLWLVALTNLINLIDGIDGLAGGVGFLLMCLVAQVGIGVQCGFSTLVAAGMAGALLGFLRYNFPPARIYMGDGGAYFLGFLIGVLSIVNAHKGSVAAGLIAPLFALALPIADVSLAVVRRGLKGLPIFRPDRKHIHHRLLQLGLSRRRAVLALYSISLLCLALALGAFWLQGRLLPLFLGSLLLVLVMAGRTFGFGKDWRMIGTSLALRGEIRYALTLSQWLQMEAERCDSVKDLWEDYQFIVRKLGFAEVELKLSDGVNRWLAEAGDELEEPFARLRHEIPGGGSIELSARSEILPEKLFEVLGELAAEAWQKAALRWQELNEVTVGFNAVAVKNVTRKAGEFKFAVPANRWRKKESLA